MLRLVSIICIRIFATKTAAKVVTVWFGSAINHCYIWDWCCYIVSLLKCR